MIGSRTVWGCHYKSNKKNNTPFGVLWERVYWEILLPPHYCLMPYIALGHKKRERTPFFFRYKTALGKDKISAYND